MRCAACHTDARFYGSADLCPVCEKASDLIEMISEELGPRISPDEATYLFPKVRHAAWEIARLAYDLAEVTQ